MHGWGTFEWSDGRIYEDLFQYFSKEHNIDLLESDMQEIIDIILKNNYFDKLEFHITKKAMLDLASTIINQKQKWLTN